jgi:hypothetical protein
MRLGSLRLVSSALPSLLGIPALGQKYLRLV